MEKRDIWLILNIVNIYETFRILFRKSKRMTKAGKAVCGKE